MRRPFPAKQPQSTDPYHTKPVEPIGKWGGTPNNWSVQVPITPNQYNLFRYEEALTADSAQVYRALQHQLV